jgi:multimeric flavodoxin WrbA
MKKALVLMGSPRRNGFTAKLVDCFMEQWKKHITQQDSVTVIDAYQSAINPCIHCGHCKLTQGCRYNDSDDFRIIDQSLRETDLLVIGSPVYGLGFPAPLKAIFDRTQQYFEAKFSLGIPKPIEKHKPVLLLVPFGSKDPRGLEILQESVRLTCLLMNAHLEHTIAAPHTDRVPVNLESIQVEMNRFITDLITISSINKSELCV